MKRRIIISVFLTLLFAMAQAQNINVGGTVTDSQGYALPGVSVIVKGTKTGVVTDIKGKYTIAVPSDKSILVFSFIGMISQEVRVAGRTLINIRMEDDLVAMDEVVVTAFGNQQKSMVAGSMVSPYTYGGGARTRRESESYQQFNTEGYSTIRENGFRRVADSPLSTFSIDVDNAAYSNVRRFINNGQLPPVDAVRIEEMINYFTYNYAEPTGEHPFSVNTEVASCPWNSKNLLLHVGLKGKSIDKSELPASNIVFLIDVSGSMSDANKLPLLKSAFRLLVNELRPVDRVAIVVYAGAAGLVLESTPGNRKEQIIAALDNLEAGGSTAGGAGLKLAYQVAGDHFMEGGNNRIIIATDGDFNVGASSNAEMERMVERERERGIFITALGFGMGNYKDDKMELIANKGNGNYAYIDNIQEARKVLVKEFGGTLFTIAKDVKFQIEFNPANVESYRLIGYENRLLNDEDFNDDKKDAGEMGSGHTVTALYEIVPRGAGKGSPAVDPLKYQTPRAQTSTDNSELVTIKMRYKQPTDSKSVLFDQVVKRGETSFARSSESFRFAASVAAFGMMLRDSEHKNDLNWTRVAEMATSARGRDEDGYRAEFIRLVKAASEMSSDNQTR
jgi:Ca-activated chloride channel family protein